MKFSSNWLISPAMLTSRCSLCMFNDALSDCTKWLKWDTVSGFGFPPARCSHLTVKGRQCWFYLPLLLADCKTMNLHNYLVSWTWPCLWRYCFEKSFLMQQLLAPGSPVGRQNPQQDQPEAVLGLCEQPACLNTCRDWSHFTCSSPWPRGDFETAHHWEYENFVHKARQGNINNLHTLRTGREVECWTSNELKHEKLSQKY